MNDNASTRRQFLAASASASASAAATVAAGWVAGKPMQAQTFNTTLHKAMIVGPVTEKVLEPIKAAGFEGDIGNHVKYLIPPQDWIRTLGGLIIKLHFKGFQLNPDHHGGRFVHLRDDSIDWRAVRKALDDINYNGWGSIEESGLPFEEFARRFDLIAEGK